LEIRGKVLPVTVKKATLVAELSDGSMLYGETAIDIPRGDQREKIRRVFIVPHHSESIEVYPPVIKAIDEADLIVIGPGDLYSSIIPNLLVPGVSEAICSGSAKIAYVINIMTKFGETEGFGPKDFVVNLENYLNRKVDYVILNTAKPAEDILEKYLHQKASLVGYVDEEIWGDRHVVKGDLLYESGGIVRHDQEKLADLIIKLLT
jgi:uncharacterized cofD-like protein